MEFKRGIEPKQSLGIGLDFFLNKIYRVRYEILLEEDCRDFENLSAKDFGQRCCR